MQGLRNHYQVTAHDPYRPIAVFRTEHSHVLQLRPQLPIAIGEVQYIVYGMTALSVYLPFYQGMTSVPEALTLGDNKADNHSAYWKFRKLQTLALTEDLTNELFTRLTIDTDKLYNFSGS
ncbi:Dipeptidase A [Photobacterium aquimaris]|uniref:Dipeptidase n=2 Tax=Photobacterium aquimaris TaxID=512643 RepID=A0A1Y6KWY2_9GAMM|nr:Dipeptidase A [Photobacterium aquimaris]